MEVDIKLKMSKMGVVLALLCIGSIILKFVGYNFFILSFIDYFGDTLGWVLRALLVLIGTLLYFKYRVDDEELNFDED